MRKFGQPKKPGYFFPARLIPGGVHLSFGVPQTSQDSNCDSACLLTFDEFEKVGEALNARRLSNQVLDELRHTIQHRTQFALLFAGVQTLDEMGPEWSSYFINVRVLTMGYLSAADAEELIRQPDPATPLGLQYTDRAVKRILANTLGQPYLIQLIGSSIVEIANARQTQQADVDLVEDGGEAGAGAGRAVFSQRGMKWPDRRGSRCCGREGGLMLEVLLPAPFNRRISGPIEDIWDGGASFVDATLGISDSGLFISPFVMDPSEPQRLWTGGRSMWRTDNGAGRWAQARGLVGASGTVSAIAVAPSDPDFVLAGQDDGDMHRTSNGLGAGSGTSWASVRPRSGYVASVAFDPGDLLGREKRHPVVVVGVVDDIAEAVGLLEAADAMLEPGFAGDGPRSRERPGIAGVREERRLVGVVGDADVGQVRDLRDPPRLG